jgi:hypothetical protein
MKSLLPKEAIPQEFNLTAAPDGKGHTVVTFTSEKGTKVLGTFDQDNLNGSIIAKVFPNWKMPWMVEMGLKSFKLPKSFVARAYPDDEEIVLTLSVPLKEGSEPWTKEKRVKVNEWDLSQMGDVLMWVKEARKLDT